MPRFGIPGAFRRQAQEHARDGRIPLYPAMHRNHDALANNAFLTRWDSGRARPMDSSYSFALRAIIAGLTAAAR